MTPHESKAAPPASPTTQQGLTVEAFHEKYVVSDVLLGGGNFGKARLDGDFQDQKLCELRTYVGR